MAVLIWKHNRPRQEARASIEAALAESGNADSMTWDGYTGSAQLGPWGLLLDARIEVTDSAVILHQCSGALGASVLQECRTMLAKLFPEGREPAP